MPVHCEDLNLLYLCSAKTGSTSVSTVLLEQLGGRWSPRESIYDGDQFVVDHKHASLSELVDHGVFSADDISSMHLAITVRNPFAFVVSGYRFRRQTHAEFSALGDRAPQWMRARADDARTAVGVTFDEYVQNQLAGTMMSVYGEYVEGFEDHPSLTFLRTEHVDDDLNALLSRLGVAWRIELPRTNATSVASAGEPAYRSMYSDSSRAVVAEAYRDDIERFGYEF